MNTDLKLLTPSMDLVESYRSALLRGWSPSTARPEASREELTEISNDPVAFVQKHTDLKATGAPIPLPDGSLAHRLPSFIKWLWDGEFSGVISFRWDPGTEGLPPHVLGHVGYSVVPWKQGKGYATRALSELVRQIGFTGLDYIEITTDFDNRASQRVAEKSGAIFHEEFVEPEAHGGNKCYRYRLHLR